MAKTAASDVWHKPIKEFGDGFIELISRIADQGGTLYAGTGLEVADDGIPTKYTTDQPDWQNNISIAEDVVDDDVYCLVRKLGAKVLHNQKLAGAYQIGTWVVKTAAGTWTAADKDTAGHLLMEIGIVCGPADRITDGAIKDIDDALSATEPVDICV